MSLWIKNAVFLAAALALGLGGASRLLKNQPFPEPAGFAGVQSTQSSRRTLSRQVDQELEREWKTLSLVPAPRAPDLVLARRLSLALTGTIPSVEELRAYEQTPPADRLEWWLSHLFEDRRFSDYLAERLARISVGVEDGPFILYRRHRLVSWLSDQILANRPYDQIVRELVASEGIWTSRPEVNFITVTVDPNNDGAGPDEQKLAARVSRAFLGVRIDCVQCHDDMFGTRWKQKDFHQLAAFFAPAEMSLTGVRDNAQKDYRHRYLRKSDPELVPPKVPFQEELLPAEGPIRERLAHWITHPANRPFARTVVNRMWALLFSRPLHSPIDDIPLNGPFPPGMETLADDLILHRYDLQRLLRIIVATQAFQRDSRSHDPEHPLATDLESKFASFPVTRLRPEQVAGSILQSASLKTLDADSHVLVRTMRFFQQRDFIKNFGDIGEDEFGEVGGTVPQRLLLMNGNLVKERTKDNIVLNAATRIAALAPTTAAAIEIAYLATLTRRPTSEETAYFEAKSRQEKPGKLKPSELLEDLFWTLINSTEYSWNH